MARIRTIKPEFWTSEQVVECSPNARLLFIGLWNFCDDAGRHPASTKRLKMEVFPADDFTDSQIKSLIEELAHNDLLTPYVVDGEEFWQVTGWHHQRIDQPTFKHPSPTGAVPCSPNKRRTPSERSESVHPRKGMEGKVKERKKDCSEPPKAASEPASEWLFPTVGTAGQEWALPLAKLNEFTEAFPGIEVAAELRKARQWCRDNATKRKTPKGMLKFLNRWLSRAQDGAGSRVTVEQRFKPAVKCRVPTDDELENYNAYGSDAL